jgi:hypothetical protein
MRHEASCGRLSGSLHPQACYIVHRNIAPVHGDEPRVAELAQDARKVFLRETQT